MPNNSNQNIAEIIIERITSEFQSILNQDPSTYGGFNVVITNEQQYVKTLDKKPKTIFIVVKFLQGSRDYGQQRQPFTINAVSEQDSIDTCQKLMMDFSETYNLKAEYVPGEDGYTFRQSLSTVSAMTNFNEVWAGFRSVFYISGTAFIGIKSNPIKKIRITNAEYGDDNEIEFVSAQLSYGAQQDSQPFYGTNNFNRSVSKIGSLSVGFTIYAVKTPFFNDILNISMNKNNSVDINKTFNIEITFEGSNEPFVIPMKLNNMTLVQEVRDFPAVSLTFAR